MSRFKAMAFLVILLIANSASAVIVDQQDDYFAIQFESTFAMSVKDLNAHIFQIGEWWDPAHTYTGDSNNLYIDLEKECFCERLPGGGYVNHLSLVYYQPGVLLRFVGGLGPLQSIPVNGVMEFRFKRLDDKQTQLNVSYLVSGNSPGLKDWAGPVHWVIQQQLNRLASQVEKK